MAREQKVSVREFNIAITNVNNKIDKLEKKIDMIMENHLPHINLQSAKNHAYLDKKITRNNIILGLIITGIGFAAPLIVTLVLKRLGLQ